MIKISSSVKEREMDFFQWLSPQVTNKQLSDLCNLLPVVNEYGKKRNRLEASLFELKDSEHAEMLQKMLKEDKRFQFMHYGQAKPMLLLVEKYCEYIREKGGLDIKPVPEDTVEQNTVTASEDNLSKTVKVNEGQFELRTKKGFSFYGGTPMEAFAQYCDYLADSHPAIMYKLVGLKYAGHGSVVLHKDEPANGGYKLNNVNCYVDKSFSSDAVINYGKWLSKMCGESDFPERISKSEKKYIEKRPLKDEKPVVSVVKQDDSVVLVEEKKESPKSASRVWSKYEVALLIEAYLEVEDTGYISVKAGELSQTLRELAKKQGKSIDDSYRNVNGMIMQLGAVQYCFTDGKKGLSNASTQIREMVDLYKNKRSEYESILKEAHEILKNPESEIGTFLNSSDFDLLKNELAKQGIMSVSQLRTLDLWSFMNRNGLYSLSKRNEILNRVNDLLHPEKKADESKKYCLITTNGQSFYSNSPAGTLAAYCEPLISKYPLKMRSLVGQRYNGIGLIVLNSEEPVNGGIFLSGLKAYIDSSLTEKPAKLYGEWLSKKCGDNDVPQLVQLCEAEKQKEIVEVERAAAASNKQERVVSEPVREEKKQEELTGDAWLFNLLSEKDINFDDKRNVQGCLWILGGSELAPIVKQCAEKGYKFTYKEDGCKAFPKQGVWWTKDSPGSKPVNVVAPVYQRDLEETAVFRGWLSAGFSSYMRHVRKLSEKSISQYCQSVEAIEQYLIKKHSSMTLVGIDVGKAKIIRTELSYDKAFVEWNKKAHYQYSAALTQYIYYLQAIENEKKALKSGLELKHKYTMKDDSEIKNTSQPKSEKLKNDTTIREAIVKVLTDAGRPMTVGEIYAEIVLKQLYSFNSSNPRMIVDQTVRKSCVGVHPLGHTKEDAFEIVGDVGGRTLYGLIGQYTKVKPLAPFVTNPNFSAEESKKAAYKANQKVDMRWAEVLAKCFPDGYINDFLSQLQAKSYWEEMFGIECDLDGDAIYEAMKTVGTVHDDRVFVRSEEESDLIESICSKISDILKDYSAVYRKCIYGRYQEKLAVHSIYTEQAMEERLLEKANSAFYSSWGMFLRKGKQQSVTNDCRKVLRNQGGAMPVSEVQKILWFVPGDTVYHTLSVDKEALNIGNSVWMLAEHFPLSPAEAAGIGDVLDEYFIANNYIQAESILFLLREKLPSIADNLQDLHFTAVFNIVRYYLEDRFSFTKAIITPKGSKKIDFSVLYHDFAAKRDHFTLDELSAFSKEVKNPIYWESVFSGGAVRVNESEFVHISNVKFDVVETDKVLEDICPGDYMPFYSVSPAMMMHLPSCGYQWNGFLLLNYVYSFSKMFRAFYKSIGKTGYYGAMVRRDCQAIGSYNQLLVRFLTDNDNWNTVDDACELVVKKGLQAAKDIGGIDKIVSQAKLNKMKKGE